MKIKCVLQPSVAMMSHPFSHVFNIHMYAYPTSPIAHFACRETLLPAVTKCHIIPWHSPLSLSGTDSSTH